MVVQMVRHLPAMQESWIRSLGWKDPLEEGMATDCSILAWRPHRHQIVKLRHSVKW